MISLDLKSLYTNVPRKKAIDIALIELQEQDEPLSIGSKTMERLMNMIVSQVHFKCKETWQLPPLLKDVWHLGHLLPLLLHVFG